MKAFLASGQWAWLWPVVKASLFFIAGFFIAKLASKAAHKFSSIHASAQQSMILEKLVFITVFLLFAISALQQLNFQLSVLLGSAGIITAAIGFAAKSSISNVISGVFLIIEKSFEVGDTIKLNGTTGVVRSIDFLSVKIRTFDNTLVRIPNEKILGSDLTNLTHYRTRRIDIMIGISYDQDIEPVKRKLIELSNNHEKTLKKPEPVIRVTDFGESAINLRFSVYAAKDDYGSVKAELFEQIKTMFDHNKFEIPYPQLTIHQVKET